ncbi:Beta-glucosidase BoGH3B [Phytophthora citrophthora]|uniref:Beta-glucosidase BoGH3B n=1 Tax=Phytophthora citrophthora TaxID=4793 RepID=A0AAD9H0C7_9STRA|nr:Beta-glucosidase BoGH3B [Phytophthora citrophthora]
MVGMDLPFTSETTALLDDKPGILNSLKESARRVINLKIKLSLYDDLMPGEGFLKVVGNEDNVSASLAGARELIVLLQNNDNAMPLAKGAKVFLTGHSVHNIGY